MPRKHCLRGLKHTESAYCDQIMYQILLYTVSGGLLGRWDFVETLTEGFLLRVSEYFCRKGTNVEAGSVASSGCRDKSSQKTYLSYSPINCIHFAAIYLHYIYTQKVRRASAHQFTGTTCTYRGVVDEYQKQMIHCVLKLQKKRKASIKFT